MKRLLQFTFNNDDYVVIAELEKDDVVNVEQLLCVKYMGAVYGFSKPFTLKKENLINYLNQQPLFSDYGNTEKFVKNYNENVDIAYSNPIHLRLNDAGRLELE